MKRSLILLSLLPLSLSAKELPPTTVGFKKIQLLDKYVSEGASIGDINMDGKPDIIAGPLWWEGPDFKKSHSYEPVTYYPNNTGYSENFFTFPDLFTKDKWTDILKVGLPSKPAYIAINPGEKPFAPDNKEHTCEHCKAQDHICNESPQYLNIVGKDKQLLSYSGNHITLATPDRDPTKPWKTYHISGREGRFGVYEHGLGAGDINGDGLVDVLEKRGWWEQPRRWNLKSKWKFHPYPFAPQQGGAQMFAYDVDGDGDNDVVTSLNAHKWGFAWYEQIKKGRKIDFKAHTIMTDKPEGNPYGVCFSQLHAMDCVDIDGDGIKDIVTGKCYFAHNGKDPGAHQPAVLYWFRTTRHKDGTTELVPYQIDDNSGVGRQISTGDLNGDGKPDIVTSNKKGVYVFIQTKVDPKTAEKKNTELKPRLYEAEALTVSRRVGSLTAQDMAKYGANVWSNNNQLWWTRARPGQAIELSFHVPTTGEYHLGIGCTKARDYGIIQVYLDRKKVGNPIDLYDPNVTHTGTVPLGEKIKLTAGTHNLGLAITGANPKAAKSYMAGIDYLILHPGTSTELLSHRPKKNPPATPPKRTGGRPLKKGNAMDAEARTPEEQLASFKLPKGFTAELVASELQGLIKPISIAFDDAGRLWTQTAREYPKDKDHSAFRNPGKDKILVFDSPWKEGTQTPRTYADGLTMPVSVLPHDHGVLVMHGPDILLLEDTDNDGKADKRTTLFSGFGIQDTHTTAHQLTRTPGGWINFSQGCNAHGTVTDSKGNQTPFNRSLIGRFKPSGTNLQIIGAGMNNIWCWAINGEGRTYIHEANDLGYSHAAFERDTTYPSFVNTKRYPDSIKHPPTAEGLGLGGTGFSGIAISEDKTNGYPSPWTGVHFVANPITGAINTVSYKIDNKGIHRFKKEKDLLTSSDPMFRPVAVSFGPDGCLYIIDWYNRIISHNEVSTDHPSRDKVSGRIWRIRHESQKRITPPNLETVPDEALLPHLLSGNIWQMRAAWNQTAKRNATVLIPALKKGINHPRLSDSVKVHLLWCLESLGHYDAAIWTKLLADSNPNIRFQALRSLSTLQPSLSGIHPTLTRLANDKSYLVLNELVRFYRDTPQTLTKKHEDFLRNMQIPSQKVSKRKVKGWGGEYLALGGAYEQTFLNQLINKALTRGEAPPALPNEALWNKVIATHPAPDAAKKAATEKEIHRLTKISKELTGNPETGKTHYTTRCAGCHEADSGGFAPALNGGKNRSAESIITAMLDPNAAVESVFHTYRIIKKDGSTVEGFRSDLSSTEVTLTFMGGGKVKIPINDIDKAGYVRGKSVMLENMSSGLKDQDVTDLIAYIQTLN